ncbi:hypothetical protein P8452_06368 [Trifolium repens]|nr:hypothetical protein P8452_06368 [Trifolium repens]
MGVTWPLSPETTAAIHLHYGHVGNSQSTELHSSCSHDYFGRKRREIYQDDHDAVKLNKSDFNVAKNHDQ